MCHHLQCEFEELVCERPVTNCLVTPNDVTKAYKILGPGIEGLRCKVMRRVPTKKQLEYVKIAPEIIKQNEMVIIAADLMFMSQMPSIFTDG